MIYQRWKANQKWIVRQFILRMGHQQSYKISIKIAVSENNFLLTLFHPGGGLYDPPPRFFQNHSQTAFAKMLKLCDF